MGSSLNLETPDTTEKDLESPPDANQSQQIAEPKTESQDPDTKPSEFS